MAQVRLASWYDGHAPGDVVEVPDEQVRPLARDGRVAEVLAGEPAPPAPGPARPAEEAGQQAGEQSAEPSRRRLRKGDE